jgi:WD40 repeat protein
MQEAADRYEKRRLLPREVAGTQQIALRESIELKYQMRLLFKLLGKQHESVRGVCDDDAWVMQQFTELLHVPRYALIKTCPGGVKHEEAFDGDDDDDEEEEAFDGEEDEAFDDDDDDEEEEEQEQDEGNDVYLRVTEFHPLIYEEKMYSNVVFGSRDIEVRNCNDDSLITTLTGHNDFVHCLIIDDGKLYSSSDDSTIKIWNCSTDTLITTLEGHTDCVWCLTINDGKLYSGSSDHSIMVWNCSNHKLITTLGAPEEHDEEGQYEGHTDYVVCLTINDGKVYSGSWDETIKVWDCSTNKLITTLTEHDHPVSRLRIHSGKLYSEAHNVVKVYDCSDDTLITTLEDHADSVRCLEIHDGKLYTGSSDKTINVYDCSDDSLITTLRGHTDWVSDLTFQNGKLYSTQAGGDIYIWQL